MSTELINPSQVIAEIEKTLSVKLTEAQYVHIWNELDRYSNSRINHYISITRKQQATSKQPVINQLPSKEQTSLDDLLPF